MLTQRTLNKTVALITFKRIGYESQNYFCKVFKDYTGMTPTAYKQQFKTDYI